MNISLTQVIAITKHILTLDAWITRQISICLEVIKKIKMKLKSILGLLLLPLTLVSCYPPQLIYVLDKTRTFPVDSVEVALLDCSCFSLNTRKLDFAMYVSVTNHSNTPLTLGESNKLDVLMDSIVLHSYFNSSSKLPRTLAPRAKDTLYFWFKTDDYESRIYHSTRERKIHFLQLHLDLKKDIKKIQLPMYIQFKKRKRI